MNPFLVAQVTLAMAVHLAPQVGNAVADDMGLEGPEREQFLDGFLPSFVGSFVVYGIRAAFGLPDPAVVARNN